MSRPPRPTQFAPALKAALREEAVKRGRTHNQVALEFVMQRFLARVFADPDSPWVLKGGTSLLMRLAGARHSRDLDLMHHPSVNLNDAIAELRELSHRDGGDPFTFVLNDAIPMSAGTTGASIKAEAYLGATLFRPFSIDLSTDLSLVTQVERVDPPPVVQLPGHDLRPLPHFTLYPIPNQIADKVCALYEQHGSGPSTRYRDLVDLVLITTNLEIDAHLTHTALTTEAARRHLTLPSHLHSPGPQWDTNYRATAQKTQMPTELHELTTALHTAGACLNPLLAGEITTGTWAPDTNHWNTNHPVHPRSPGDR